MDDDIPDDVMEIYQRVSEDMQSHRYDGSPQSEPVRNVTLAFDHWLILNGGFDGYVGNGYDLGPFLHALRDLGITETDRLIADIEVAITGFATMPQNDVESRLDLLPKDGAFPIPIAVSYYFDVVSPQVIPAVCRMISLHPDEFKLTPDERAVLAGYFNTT
jgi:hypothetical protein